MARRWEAADTVVALATGLLVVVFAVFGFLIWQGNAATVAQAEARAQASADVIAEESSWLVGANLALLETLARDIGGEPQRVNAGPGALFAKAAATLPAKVVLGVYDANGKQVSAPPAEGAPESIARSDFLVALAQGTDWQVSAVTSEERPGFVVAKRLEANGTFTGVALVAIDEQVMADFWARQNLGPESTVSVLRTDGWVVARYPALTQPLDLSKLPVFQTLSSGPSGTYDSPSSPADGVARIVGFRHVPSLGLIALASVSRDAVLGNLWSAVRTVLYLMGPIAVALLAGSFLTARLLRNSERTRRNLAAAVAHNEVLFREIHHRVKNNLQSVASLLQLQPIPREIKTEMAQRINAMSAVHEHIYRSNNFSTVHVREYLRTLIENIRAGQDPAVKVIEELEDLPVEKDNATPLGLILNEVVSNAFKHAFVDGREGVVVVRLVRENDTTGRLQVEDNGVGFEADKPTKGIGRRLIVALTEQLGGQSSFASGASGARFTLTFPLAAIAAERAGS